MTDDHLKALGRVAVNFQTMELFIATFVMGLIGPDQTIGQMVTVQLPFGKLCVLAGSLFQYKFKGTTYATKFDELVRRGLELEAKRNQLFHSTWLTGGNPEEITRLKASLKLGKGLEHSSPSVSPEEIHHLADEMGGVAENIGRLIGEMTAAGLNKG